MYFHFRQNNSGGYFTLPAQNVIVEADSWEHANERFRHLEVDHSFCECCGERWHELWSEEGDAEPMVYGTPAREVKRGFCSDKDVPLVFILPLQGEPETINGEK